MEKFKVEVKLQTGQTFKEFVFANDLTDLEKVVAKQFPNCKIISIVGGYES